jgi:hypothetical protein
MVAIWSAASNRCVSERSRRRQLGFVGQPRHFERDFGVGPLVPFHGQQDATCGYIRRGCKVLKLFPGRFAVHENGIEIGKRSHLRRSNRDDNGRSPAIGGLLFEPKSVRIVLRITNSQKPI